MSDSMSPWLRKAAEKYADVHGDLLGQQLSGERLQLLSVTGNPDHEEMWTEMGDKQLWISVLFPRNLISAFNAKHGFPFLSLRHHLFTIDTYTFAILQPHAASRPGSDFPFTTLSPRMCIKVHSFRYFGSGWGLISDGPSLGCFAEQKGELGAWLRSTMEKWNLDMQHMGLDWRPTGEDPPPVEHSKSSPMHSQRSVRAPEKKVRAKRKFETVWDHTDIDCTAQEWCLSPTERVAFGSYNFLAFGTVAKTTYLCSPRSLSPAPTSPAHTGLPTSPAHTVLTPRHATSPSTCPNPSLDDLPEEVEELLEQGRMSYPPPRQKGRNGSESMETGKRRVEESEDEAEIKEEVEIEDDVEMDEAQRSEEERSGGSDVVDGDDSSSESPAQSLRSSIPFGTLGDADPSFDSSDEQDLLPDQDSRPHPSLAKSKRTPKALLTPATTSTALHDLDPSPEKAAPMHADLHPSSDPAPSSPIRAELVERSQQRSQEEGRRNAVRLRSEEVLRRETRWEMGGGRRRVRVLEFEEWLSVRGDGEEALFDEVVMERLRKARA